MIECPRCYRKNSDFAPLCTGCGHGLPVADRHKIGNGEQEIINLLREEVEDLKSEIENLHIENDTLCKRVQNHQPGMCTICQSTVE